MKTQYLLFSLLLSGLTATAQDSAGFDFSGEVVAALRGRRFIPAGTGNTAWLWLPL